MLRQLTKVGLSFSHIRWLCANEAEIVTAQAQAESDKVEWEVCEAPVIAVPHEQWTEYPLAVVVPLEAAKLSAEELGEYLSGNFAKWWLPDAYEFTDKNTILVG